MVSFKVQPAALNAALDVVKIVEPRPFTPQGASGFLFVVRKDADGKDLCFIYSRDETRMARAYCEISDVQGEGAFILPGSIDSFKFVENPITFTADCVDDVYTVKYDLGGGAGAERPSFDPRYIGPFDKKLDEATGDKDFPSSILLQALDMATAFAADPKDTQKEEHFKTYQIFDDTNEAWAKGDGTLFAANGTCAFFFSCEAFKGHGFQIYGGHLPKLMQFLARASGKVTVKSCPGMTFVVDGNGSVLGYSQVMAAHTKYARHKTDHIILEISKKMATNAIKYMQTEMKGKEDKISFAYDHAEQTIRFRLLDNVKAASVPVPVKSKEGSQERDAAFNMSANQLLSLFEKTKAEGVEFRICVLPATETHKKERAMFRTVDEFWLDNEGKVVGGSGIAADKRPEGAFKCFVTRFMPGRD